ncbi:DUF1870 family protein [Nocardiopsis sp. FR26]|uniref:Aca2/YdiL-like domain-containing protein n=1 Tax=Nocardiopsis sp. FR26 TaxID=2605987 RepID=UPI001916B511|nr:DUF1870 family protein [Nocardiopsis sp. FR26]
MTPAEIKVIREGLGFTGDALAGYLSPPVSGRTVRHWETGKYNVPDGVAAEIRSLEQTTTVFVEELAATLQGQDDPTLTVYRDDTAFHAARPDLAAYPAAWHRAVAARVARLIPHLRIEFPE